MTNNTYKLSQDQHNALQKLMSGENVFLTGKAGTGKTHVINIFCNLQKENGVKIARTASTALAARLVGGTTVHKICKLWAFDRNIQDMEFITSEIKDYDVLVIDEISMIDARQFTNIAKCLNYVKKHIQLVVVGDFYQLPPVTKYTNEKTYAFDSHAWNNFNFSYCILDKIHRQGDLQFINNLNMARIADSTCLDYFVNEASKNAIENAIWICGTNLRTEEINAYEMERITSETIEHLGRTTARCDIKHLPVERHLALKQGMRVMTVVNDKEGRFCNGSMGTLIQIKEDELTVCFDNGEYVEIKEYIFPLEERDINDNPIQYMQFPIKPAYAITSHKCQGMTFNAMNIWMDKCWEPGQLYVVLSRCKDVKNVYFQSPISKNDFKVDPKVSRFYSEIMNVA